MQIAPVESIYSAYEPYDIPETLPVNETKNTAEENSLSVNDINGIEPTATSVAISAIPQESIQLQELQQQIISNFDELKNGEISKEEFSSSLENLGIEVSQTNSSENQSIQNLSSALIESVRNSNGEVELSSYASAMDKINEETQTPDINEKLQAYTQNLRN